MTAVIAGQLSLYDALGAPEPEPARSVDEPEPDLARSADDPGSVPPRSGEEPEPDLAPLEVRVTRSARRRKTAEAKLVESVLEIRIPAASTDADERHFVEHFRDRFERSRAAAAVDLERRAERLSARYDLPRPTSIRWVGNQRQQWGSCTPADGSIRLSDRMARFPDWVVDYVIVHELAHLVEADHGPAFWALVDRYPRTERARGYLLAKDGA
jgi:predicted metal-dependent hydrolase